MPSKRGPVVVVVGDGDFFFYFFSDVDGYKGVSTKLAFLLNGERGNMYDVGGRGASISPADPQAPT